MCSSSSSSSSSTGSVGIIGGGMAGVAAARHLAVAGVPVVLHERTAQLGGRLGTADVDGRAVGMGCLYISAKESRFVRQLDEWCKAGHVAEWCDARPHKISAPGVWSPLPVEQEARWYVGRPHMGSLVQCMLSEQKGITVRQGDVFDVNHGPPTGWVVATHLTTDAEDEDEEEPDIESHLYEHLIVATPVDDAAAFLERKVLDRALGRGRYKDFVKERISVAFVFEAGLDLPFGFAALTFDGSPVTVAIDETSRRAAGEEGAGGKGGGGQVCSRGEEVWVVQSATGWARRALDEEWELEAMGNALLDAFAAGLSRSASEMPAVRAREVVIWPYGDMDYEVDGGCVWDAELGLAMAGDWAYTGRLEGAWLSGVAAAQRVLDARSVDEVGH